VHEDRDDAVAVRREGRIAAGGRRDIQDGLGRAAPVLRNPATGETIKIPAKTVLKFRIAKAAKDAVLGAAPTKKKR
jgi:hypothetical protein